jgi:hypothetical protein
LFANTGEDSEHPDTIRYVREVARPYADRQGLELVELQKRRRDGSLDTLRQRIRRGRTTVPIPMRMPESGAPGNRTCTDEFKIRVCAKELKARGATEAKPARIGLGITTDEYQRIRTPVDPRQPALYREYPLVFDLALNRQDCINVIVEAGLPVPPKSACFFCPFHGIEQWRQLRRTRRDLFDEACAIEREMQERRAALGRDPVWLTDQGQRWSLPLARLLTHDQMTLDDETACESGFCMT